MSYLDGLVNTNGGAVAKEDAQSAIIARGEKLMQETRKTGMIKGQTFESRYPALAAKMEEANLRDRYIAAATAIVMNNQDNFIEQMKINFGEATITQNLGQLAPRLLDVVRIFFPNQIANLIAEVQPMETQIGSVLTIQPVYNNTAAGVNKGDEVFKAQTNGSYASDLNTDLIGTGNGSTTTFSTTASIKPLRPGTVQILSGGIGVAVDDGNGKIVSASGSGTVNYATGAISFTFGAAPTASTAVTTNYRFDIERTPDSMRELDIQMNLIPVQAKPHPLRINWSVQAQLAAQSQYNIDVADTLSNLAAQYIRKERDYELTSRIQASSVVSSTLNFDAAAASGLTKKQHYQDFGIKIGEAENLIFNANGRGNVSFIIAGINAANVIAQHSTFVPDVSEVPVGSHKIGTINGNIDVIKDRTLPANRYTFGFRGMQMGDAATILAEWIPIYFTPTFQNSNLNNSQGLLSMYDILMNNTKYYYSGDLSNYSA